MNNERNLKNQEQNAKFHPTVFITTLKFKNKNFQIQGITEVTHHLPLPDDPITCPNGITVITIDAWTRRIRVCYDASNLSEARQRANEAGEYLLKKIRW